MLPPLDKPYILDVGCGCGGPTLELARLSQGYVIGLDIRQSDLDELARKAAESGLSERVKTVNCSMFQMDFPDESFDIIWAEGSIWLMGFERGLREWKRFLKAGGFLIVHEMAWLRPDPPQQVSEHWKWLYPGIRTVPEYLERIPSLGYDIIGHFALPEDFWWLEYFGPLQHRIDELREKYSGDSAALEALDGQQHEVDMYKKYQPWYGSAFFVMKKR
jgi:SAM-dependent methyltransferase